jgi:hypothetical protein
MALTEVKVIDKIEIVENGSVQIREVTRIMKDGAEIAHTYHRWTFAPGQNIADQPEKVQAICNVAWTDEVIAAYAAQQEANRLAPRV